MLTENIMKSLCPICRSLLETTETIESGNVYIHRTCPEHGSTKTLVSTDTEYWTESLKYDRPGSKPLVYSSTIDKGCPDDCGICTAHKQHTCVGIIEITGQCNLTCNICFAEAPSGDHVPYDQITTMIDAYVSYESDPELLQLSGGEPTLHPNIIEIVRYAKDLGIQDVAVSTNGLRLLEEDFAKELASTDPVIYLQFDTFDSEVSKKIRGRDLVEEKKRVVQICNNLGMTTVLVPTIVAGLNVNEIGAIIEYGLAQKKVFGINFQPVSLTGRIGLPDAVSLTIPQVLHEIETQTKSNIDASNFRPIPCPHPHCTSISYMLVDDEEITPLTDLVDVDDYIDYAKDRTLVNEAVLMNEAFTKLFSTRAVPGTETNLEAFCVACGMTVPEVIGKTVKIISIHAFMDAQTFQLERSQKCCIHVIQPDGKLIPFCNYNMFHRHGGG
ncbi:MAG: radical SAM protein [Candidatus Thorarchaeota archaeon]